MPETQTFEFKILNDDAAIEDLFEHKTHQHSAETLLQVINSSNGNITIGLEGSWGAGKSTVINMFHQDLIQKNEASLFFLFDAWAHEDEPLRRIFLESLIQTIDPDEKNNDLQELQKKLSGRKKTVDVSAKKSASRLGKLLSVCAFAVPAGIAFFNKLNFDKLSFDSTHPIYWTFIIFLLLSLIFLFSPAWVLLYWSKRGDIDPLTNQRNWDFFRTESTENYTQDISEQGERTSIEFQNYFKQILEIAFKSNNYTKALIVIDNLDRVDPDQAKSIWSTLQTFFQNRSLSNEIANLQNKIWFIVPYDRDGFSAIWDKDKAETAASFLDKCFQVRVEVPQPITSNWLGYCRQSIDQSLIGWSQDSKDALLNEYSRIVAIKDSTPTPRKMRAWVNQVGMNGYRWKEKFSTKSLALYSFLHLQYSGTELKTFLVENQTDKLSFSKDTSLMYELAGLLFGVEKEKGAELLLKEIIQSTLDELVPNNLRKLAEEHKNVFWLTWSTNWDIFLERNSTFQSGTLNHFTNYICSEFTTNDQQLYQYMEAILKQWKTIKATDWELNEDRKYGETLNTLIFFLGKRDNDIEWLMNSIKKLCIHVISKPEDIKNSNSLTELRTLIDTVIHLGTTFPTLSYSSLNKEQWTKWLALTKSQDIKFPEIILNLNDFSSWSINIFTNFNQIKIEDVNLLIKTIPYIKNKVKWDGVVNKLIELFSTDINQRVRDVDELYELSFALISNFSFNNLEKTLKTNVQLKQTINYEQAKDNASLYYLVALLFTEEIQTQNQFERTDIKDYWKTSSQEKITQTIQFLAKYNQLGRISRIARNEENLLALEIIKSSEHEQLFGIKSETALFIDEYNSYLQNTQQITDIITKICSMGGFNDNVQSEYKNSPVIYSECSCLFLKYGDQPTQSKVIELTKNISKEVWEKDLNEAKVLLQLFNYPIQLDYKFSEAFFLWLSQVIAKGDKTQKEVWKHFDKISEYLLDKEDNFSKIFNEYFQQTEDFIDNTGFHYLSIYWQDISIISPEKVAERLKVWLDNNQWSRIYWFLTKKLVKPESKSEGLISRIITKLEEFKSEEDSPETKALNQLYDIYK
ncbi:KAP family NTPase [Acinetobacter soli]|uniref:P-loop NTPase fold protein n=1 Tax=Acinetobacter soli TaxID=487316 RepID=UPI00287EDF5A|nr:P-loop NTPase fold protein [Acinetobacter soli]MDS7695053.1 KAP family NTPase [Acinetobacter soli]